MHVSEQIRGHILPFTIAVVLVCTIGVIAHTSWPQRRAADDAASSVIELRDDAVITASR